MNLGFRFLVMDLVVVEHVKFLLGTMYSLDYFGCTTVYQLRFSTWLENAIRCWGTVNASGISHITGGNFAQSANTINGWYVISYGQSQVIQSYGSALSAYGLIFLGSLYLGIQSYVLI
jgi:hypothetical protein